MKKTKMNKNILVSVLLIASVLLLTAVASAADFTVDSVQIDGLDAVDTTVNAGDTISLKVYITSDVDARDVIVKAEIGDVEVESSKFVVVAGQTYRKTLTIKVPFDFKNDEIEDTMDLEVSVEGEEIATGDEFENSVEYDEEITVLKQSYSLAIKSVITSNTIDAGRTMPVEVVLKNIGYNDVDDVYITVSIPELNIAKSGYFGDLFALEDHDEDEYNTVSGKLNLEVPYTAKAGVYTLVVEAENDEVTSTKTAEVTIANSEIAVKSGNNLILLNPMNKPVVYKVVYNDNEVIVDVSALSSRTIAIDTTADTEVSVYAGATLLSTVKYTATSESATELELTNPVFVLTVILAIVFLVLLVVLVVLITKKPQKAEEFGESYY